jgi:hypothetical protein
MPIYTLCSTDPEHYNEIIVSIPFYNSEKVVELTVLSLCSLYNIELLNEDDYIQIAIGGLLYTIKAVALTDLKPIDTVLSAIFEKNGLPNMKAVLSSKNTLEFKYNQDFTIYNMSYNFRIATGFYYLNDKNNFPIQAEQISQNEYVIRVKASPFTSSTPILYLLANTGGNCYRMNLDADNLQTGTISMTISNSFISGMPAIFQQADITSRIYSSDLTFMRMILCDSNLKPVKLLNPMFITLSVNNVSEALFS